MRSDPVYRALSARSRNKESACEKVFCTDNGRDRTDRGGRTVRCTGNGCGAGTQTLNITGTKSLTFTPKTLNAHTGKISITLKVPKDAPSHTFGIAKLGVDTGVVRPGSSNTVTVNVKKAGTYAFDCDIHPVMMGNLVVSAASGSSQPSAAPAPSPANTAPAPAADGNSQMAQVPAGAPNTGGGSTAPSSDDTVLIGLGVLALIGAAGTALVVRRRSTN